MFEKIFLKIFPKLLDKSLFIGYNIDRKTKEDKTMKNLWKSIYTNQIYEMPIDWLPKFGGWELIGTVAK